MKSAVEQRIEELRQIVVYYIKYRHVLTRQILIAQQSKKGDTVRGHTLLPPIKITTAKPILWEINDYVLTLSHDEKEVIESRICAGKTFDVTAGLIDKSRSMCFEIQRKIIDNALFYILISPTDARDILLAQNIIDYTIHTI